jgi:hypothetical protein
MDMEQLDARLAALERKLDAAAPWAGDPQAAASVERLAARLDRVERLVEALGTLAERLPTITDAAGTMAGWAFDQAQARGVDPIAAGQDAAALGLELARPENLALVRRLLASRGSLETALDAVESVDPGDLKAVAQNGAQLTRTLAALLRLPELRALLEASADPAALGTARTATTALVETRKQPIQPLGMFAAVRKLGDPDVQRAVGFTLALAKRFGELIGR